MGAVQMTANPPAGPVRWVLLGVSAVLLVVGLIGTATVDSDSGGKGAKAASTSGDGSGSAQLTVTTPTSAPAAASPAPTTAPAGAGSTPTASAPAGPFWAVLLSSFPNTPEGNASSNVELSKAKAVDPGATVIHTETYQSLQGGFVTVISAPQSSRDAALAAAVRFREAGFHDANARCLTTGPPCS